MEQQQQASKFDALGWFRNAIPIFMFVAAGFALYYGHEQRIQALEQDKKYQEVARAQDIVLLNAKLDSLRETVLEVKQTVKDVQQFQRK